MTEKRKIIMDVDTGSDDAIALVMAMLDEGFDLLGICAVNGNVEVRLAADNSLRVVETCGMQGKVPVYRGADLPLCSTLLPYTAQSLRPIPRREGSNGKGSDVHPDHLPVPAPAIRNTSLRQPLSPSASQIETGLGRSRLLSLQ